MELIDLICKSSSNFMSIGWKLRILGNWQSCRPLADVDLFTSNNRFLPNYKLQQVVKFRENPFKIVTCRWLTFRQKNRQNNALSQLIHSCAAFGLAGCIIGYGRGYAADAVPQLPEHWCSFCQPQKDDRLSQPHVVLIQWPTGLELRTRASQVIHPNRKANTRLQPTNILEKASIFFSNI